MERKLLICFMIWAVSTTAMVSYEGVRLLNEDREIEILKHRISTLEFAAGLEWAGNK